MPTTTNYGWTTPADTDLVKDGAAAIRTLGSSIDSTLKTQIDTVTATANGAIAKSLVDAKGDLIAATANDTVARVAVGTNGQYLSADSTAAAGVAWVTPPASGGLTLLSTTVISGAPTTVTISGISQSYKNLLILCNAITTGTSALRVRMNGSTSVNYSSGRNTTAGTDSNASLGGGLSEPATMPTAYAMVYITNYASTSFMKMGHYTAASSTGTNTMVGSFMYGSTTAISSIDVTNNGGNPMTGTILIYGEN